MKLSIITVVYNNERTVTEAVESVLGQTFKDIEYIIIDGGSTDKTVARLQPYLNEINRLVSEKDKGIYDAMNKGLALATGEVIGILNSDDVYADNGVLQAVMNAFEADRNLDMIYGDLVYVKEDDLTQIVRNWRSEPYYDNYFEEGHVPPHPTLFVRRHVYQQAGVFNISMKLAADYELMLRIFKKYHFKSRYLSRLLVKMRLGGSTNKNWKNILKGNMEILQAWKINSLPVPLLLMPHRILKRLAQFKR
jgi:glycosyltransferase involved in cell wall biosynthesis